MGSVILFLSLVVNFLLLFINHVVFSEPLYVVTTTYDSADCLGTFSVSVANIIGVCYPSGGNYVNISVISPSKYSTTTYSYPNCTHPISQSDLDFNLCSSLLLQPGFFLTSTKLPQLDMPVGVQIK